MESCVDGVEDGDRGAMVDQERGCYVGERKEVQFVASTRPQKKRRHHSVWQFYLKAWAQKGKVWCLGRHGKLFRASTKNVAVETDLYKVRRIGSAEVQFVEAMVAHIQEPGVREAAAKWIPMFRLPGGLRDWYETSGLQNAEFEAHLEALEHNLEEDLHAAFEQDAVPALTALRRGERNVYDDEDMFMTLCIYLGFQHLRTTGMRDRMRRIMKLDAVDLDSAWGLLRVVFATGISFNMSARREKTKVTLMRAMGGREFITSDQPTINTLWLGIPNQEGPKELCLYFPLSPTVAALLEFDHADPGWTERRIGGDEVDHYSGMLAGECHEQLFSASKEAIADLAASRNADQASSEGLDG